MRITTCSYIACCDFILVNLYYLLKTFFIKTLALLINM